MIKKTRFALIDVLDNSDQICTVFSHLLIMLKVSYGKKYIYIFELRNFGVIEVARISEAMIYRAEQNGVIFMSLKPQLQ